MNARKALMMAGAITLGSAMAIAAEPAGKARYKKQEVEVQGVSQTQLTKPAPPPKEKKESGPVISLEEFVGKRQDKIQKITDAQINQMQRLIRVTEDSDPQKPDFYFRLAELYAEKQRYFFFQARSLDQKIFEAQRGAKASLQNAQRNHERDSERWLLKAVESYIDASKFRKYDRMDEVLFKLAYLLQSVKKEDQARDFFHRLIKDYPNSRYVPEAYLSFAEFFFQKGEMENALKFYERVEQFPKSPVYGYAVYKKGWCWINLGDFKKALQIFVDVIRLAKEGKTGDKRQNQALEREAKKDVVKAYARTPGATADKAWEFFQRVGGDFAPKMIEALGELYWEQGMFGESTKVYRKIISLNPESPRLCEWQNKIVRNTLSQGTKRDQVQEIQRLGAAYGRVSKGQSIKKDVLEECKNAYHDTTKELALIWHKEAQKTKNPDTYQLVKFVYKEYLDHFPKDKGSVDMSFYYAEVLWVTESWKEAAEQYTRVVEIDPRGKYVKEAAYAAVLAWKNALNIDDSGEGPDKGKIGGKDTKPRDIPEYQKKMISAFDTYLKYVPDSDMGVKIKYRKARIYYDYNHYDEAIKYYQEIVDKHTKDELAIYSANLLLDSLNILGRTKDVVIYVDKFLLNQDLMKDPEFQKQMVTIKVDSLDLEGRRFETEGNYKECGRSMEAAADSLPEHPKHAERLYNAALCFTNARLIGEAIRMREKLIKDHPKDALAQRALYQIASGYHQLAAYTEAARRYEEFATKFPGEQQSATALGNAYTFRIGLGMFNEAVQDMQAYIRFYGSRRPQDAADKFYQLSEVYEKQNETDQLARHLEDFLKRWGSHAGADKTILAHFKLGEIYWKKSCPKEGVGGACIEIQRVTATGRQKALYEINKKIKDKRKKIRELRTQCGPPTKSKITVYDRKKDLAKKAQGHFSTALKLWASAEKRIPGASPEEQKARLSFAAYAAAGSAFFKAEQVYEDFLRVKFPEGLYFQQPTQFDTPKKAKEKKKAFDADVKKFQVYLDQKAKFANMLAGASADKKGAYDKVVEFKVAHWMIAASARLGQVWANFMDQLYTAEIPKDLKEQDEWGNRPREIFCDTLVDKAEPIETKAVQGYDLCLKAATQQSWFNEWSNLCEQELNQMQPTEYPLAAEVKPEPGYVSTLMTPAQVMSELPAQQVGVPGKE